LTEPPEPHILRWIQNSLSIGDTFFDVGAHIGWMSLVAACCVGPSGSIVAFEPALALVEILEYHKRVNRLSQMRIVPFAVADSDRDSTPFFLVNRGLSCRNSLTIGARETPYLTTGEKTACEVRSLTLDRYMLDSGRIPSLIKIDVEGAELLVLQGSEGLLSKHHPKLIVGVHPYWMPPSHSVRQIFDLLNRHGYRVKEQQKVEFSGGYIADYLCVPRES
jgi:FkbM family methyltransferase